MEITATNENFKEIISGNAVAKEYDGKVTVVKCNVDDCEDLSMQFGIRNIPTLLFFKDGQVVDKLVGNVPKAEITSRLDAIL